MTQTAVILLIISAFTHAGWNILGKHSQSSTSSFLMASTTGVLLLLPLLLLFRNLLKAYTPTVWLLLVATGAFQALYYWSLASAYRSGDMSIAYPVARSTPAVLVALFALLSGKADSISLQALAGIALVVFGGYILPMKHFRDFSIKNYLKLSLAFALCAALGTTGYSIVDSRALELLRNSVGTGVPAWKITTSYAFFESAFSSAWLALFIMSNPRERRSFGVTMQSGSAGIGGALLMGVGIYLTYTIVLVSMAFVRDVSYVVAFRQLSIPLGVVLSALFLKEPLYRPKATGALVMFVGVVLVGLG